ncbi:MAG TPA: hypothetical protein VJR89_10070 [Polyangiales bacterium]|nr:hypothetical protein [Polyangiales bacterium]
MRESLALGITLLLALGAAGCSLLVDASDPQCDSNADCVASGLGARCEQRVCVGRAASRSDGVSSAPSSCLSDSQCKNRDAPVCMRGTCVSQDLAERWLCEPREAVDESQVIHYSFQVLEFISRKSPGNVKVLACRTNDVSCQNPVASFVDQKGDGLVELELPAGFSGFFEVKSDAVTALSYLTKPLTHDLRDRDLQVSAPTTLKLLAMTDGTEFDEDRGLALVEAFDCSGTPAGGVHFEESKGSSKSFYIIDNTPNSAAELSVYDPIHDVADGGFINVEPGFVTFRARWGVDGPVLGEFNAQVRANTFTFVDMYF